MATSKTAGVRLAVADDEPDFIKALTSLLERLGHSVVCTAANGAELLDGCNQIPVDVALVDLDMPVMDGLTAAEQLREKGIPVVLISGHPDAEQLVMEHEPIAARVRKPASVASLQTAIDLALSTNR